MCEVWLSHLLRFAAKGARGVTMRQLRQQIHRNQRDTTKGPREFPRSPDGAARALAGNTTFLALAEEILREATFYQNEVPHHTCVMMEKWGAELSSLARCRYCNTTLLADGDGGWTCPQRDTHQVADA